MLRPARRHRRAPRIAQDPDDSPRPRRREGCRWFLPAVLISHCDCLLLAQRAGSDRPALFAASHPEVV